MYFASKRAQQPLSPSHAFQTICLPQSVSNKSAPSPGSRRIGTIVVALCFTTLLIVSGCSKTTNIQGGKAGSSNNTGGSGDSGGSDNSGGSSGSAGSAGSLKHGRITDDCALDSKVSCTGFSSTPRGFTCPLAHASDSICTAIDETNKAFCCPDAEHSDIKHTCSGSDDYSSCQTHKDDYPMYYDCAFDYKADPGPDCVADEVGAPYISFCCTK